jgi:crotonobetainyl-CoA:carnitine CoA-transferase CaiB-like acyl-CoA transferase
MAASPLPLTGLLVVAIEQAVAAPLCTRRLADAGARVIKIERPEGDFARDYDHVVHGESAYFVWLNHGKQSIALDFKAEGDRALLGRLIAKADIFVQNLAPGAAARAGFGSAALRTQHSQLITCDISGYGEDGPARDMKAYDLLIQAETGLASITGTPDGPGRVGVSVADIGCGMNAHAAILEALISRGQTGEGSGIAVSLFDGIADWMAVPLLHHDYAGIAPRRVGLAHPSIAPYGAFACRDGKAVVISIQNEREWQALCRDALDAPGLLDDSRFAGNSARVANRPVLDALIGDLFAGMDWRVAVDRLAVARIAYASLNGVADLSDHSQLRRIHVDTPTGPVRLPASPMRWQDREVVPGTVPALDADGDMIRAEFG